MPGIIKVGSEPAITAESASIYSKDADSGSGVTNYALYSEQFDQSGTWLDAGVGAPAAGVVTANDGTDPNGNTTADRISGGRIQQAYMSYTSGNDYTFSLYVKGTSGQTVGLGYYNNSGDITTISYTLDGTWQRFSHTFTATATNLNSGGARIVISGNGDKSQTATNFLVWGAQLEQASSASNLYVQTTSSSATGYEQKAAMYVKDESGNETKISPHNANGEWEYLSVNKLTGKTVRVNMEEMIKDIEQLTGKTYLYNK